MSFCVAISQLFALIIRILAFPQKVAYRRTSGVGCSAIFFCVFGQKKPQKHKKDAAAPPNASLQSQFPVSSRSFQLAIADSIGSE